MSAEIRFRAQLSIAKSGVSGGSDTGDRFATMTGTKVLETIQTVGTAEEALILGEVPAANAWYQIENLDTVNSVDLKPAAGGTVTTRIGPGLSIQGRFGPLVTAPFVVATALNPDIKILLVQA